MADQQVRHNEAAHRFEAGAPPHLARLDYRLKGESVDMIHTEVPDEYQGQGLAGELASAALTWARESGRKVVASCPYVKSYIKKHPEFADLL
ncbi:MAG TPA: GNAT family N-acetyltransferase [Bryobacteraceae bacterium]|nr:GNAT family N-acetyltransferase [Bryobacteraceae bacterium]